MKTETQQDLELTENDIALALANLRDSHVTNSLNRLGILGKGSIGMATRILDGRLKTIRHYPPINEARFLKETNPK